MSSFVLGPVRQRLLRAVVAAHADPPTAPDKAKLFRGLADPTRLTILQLLTDGPRSVQEVARAINESVVGAAAQLACLEACGLIRCDTREGERRYTVRETVVQLIGAADAVLTCAGSGIRICSRFAG